MPSGPFATSAGIAFLSPHPLRGLGSGREPAHRYRFQAGLRAEGCAVGVTPDHAGDEGSPEPSDAMVAEVVVLQPYGNLFFASAPVTPAHSDALQWVRDQP